MSLTTVAASKEQAPLGYQPLCLVDLTFQDSTTIHLCSYPLNTGEGGYVYNGKSYLARVTAYSIAATQSRSELGVDRIPSVTLKLADPDFYLWNNFELNSAQGFCGAQLVLNLILKDINPADGTFQYSSDSAQKFVGICDSPNREMDGVTLTLTATSNHNMGKVYLPNWSVQQRCSNVFPATAAQRLSGATDPSSQYYFCGYSPDVTGTDPDIGGSAARGNEIAGSPYTICDYTKASCVARGMYTEDSSSRQTGRFSGIQWAPTTREARSKSYVTGKNVTVFDAANDSIFTSRFPMLYGTQYVTYPINANELGDGNSTRGETVICQGAILNYGVQQVVLNGIILPQSVAAGSTDPLERWNYINAECGSRNGGPNADVPWNRNGDPYGNLACIEWVVYRELLDSSQLPTFQILASGPRVWTYQTIATYNSGLVTLTGENFYVQGAGSFIVIIAGNSLSAANGVWTATTFASGPPGTVTLTGAPSGTGTGGFICAQLKTSNPVWILADVMKKANWAATEFDWNSWYLAALTCDTQISYLDLTGATATHAAYNCGFVIQQRRAAAEIVNMLLRSFNAQLVYNAQTGLLQLIVRQSVADQQQTAITGSNYNTAVGSIHADGTSGNGYWAYLFDETTIYRPANDGPPTFRLYTLPNVQRPNCIIVAFQDEDNSYVQDSLRLLDEEAMARIGGPSGTQIENDEQLQEIGITNFDQAVRVSNVYMAEQNYGNPYSQPRGTIYVEFETTVRGEHLTSGAIFGLNLINPAISMQSFRVLSITPTGDYERVRIVASWHNDIWYTWLFGQAPAPFYSQLSQGIPARLPFPWKPYGTQDLSTGATDYGMGIAVLYTPNADGTALAQIQIYGCGPVNQFSPGLNPPLCDMQGLSANTGGSLLNGQAVYMFLCGVDSAGLLTALSQACTAVMPGTYDGVTGANTATIPELYWPTGIVSYILFGGRSQSSLAAQQTGAVVGTTNPSSLTITSLVNGNYGPPDQLATQIVFKWKRAIHAGDWGAACSAVAHVSTGVGSITFTGHSFGPTSVFLILLANPKGITTQVPLVTFAVAGTAGATLTVTPDPTAIGVVAGSVFAQVSIGHLDSTSTIISNANFVNTFSAGGLTPGAEVGNVVMITSALGNPLGLQGTIISNTSTTITLSSPLPLPGLSEVLFVVLEPAWQATYGVSYTASKPEVSPAPLIATMDATNYEGETVFVQAFTSDSQEDLAIAAFSPYRFLYLWGNPGTTAPGYYNILPWASSITPDWDNGAKQELIMGGATVLTAIANPPSGSGQDFYFIAIQDATGGRTLAFDASYTGNPTAPSPLSNAQTTYHFTQTLTPGEWQFLSATSLS
jgi:hypothetical protein